jgi:hypothetical protein
MMPTDRFNRACKIAGLAFLLVTLGARTAWFEYRNLRWAGDYPQYYMGGVIALYGAWDSLYPIPRADSRTNPGFAENSELRPRYRELQRQAGLPEDAVRYMQPPPLALLLVPLALLPFKVSLYLWVILLILAAWGIGLQAGRIFAMSLGRDTRAAGWIVLLVCVSPQAHRWVRVGNMSVLIGWLIGYATLELVRRDTVRGALAVVVGAVAKYAILILAPLYLALRRWKTIAWGALLAALLIGASLVLMPRGPEGPYSIFFRQIAPTLSRTASVSENQALYPTLLRMLGRDDPPLPRPLEIGFRVVQIATLLLILGLIFTKSREFWRAPANVFAAALALVSWLLVFSPICWEHYHAYLAPFWGWLIYEGTKSRLRMIVAILAIALSYLPTSLLFHKIAGGRFRLPEPLFSHLACAAVLMLLISAYALAAREPRLDTNGHE